MSTVVRGLDIGHVHGESPWIVGDAMGLGQPLGRATHAMVLVHGRGGGAADMLGLGAELSAPGFAYVALQATGRTWYPHSFMAPRERNEPGLSSGLTRLDEVVETLDEAGIASHRVVLLGFSQGACLTLEFAARQARRWGAVVGLSGGLIGPPGSVHVEDFALDADFAGTPIFLGCSDRDPHIPIERVQESNRILGALGGDVETRIYPGMPHTIIEDEMRWVRERLESLVGSSR